MKKIGIIGGSALYHIEDLKITQKKTVKTPFGKPSGEFVIGRLNGSEVVFIPRHGKNHTILPSEVNYRANIYGLKSLGVDRVISVSAVGSMREDIKPLDILLVDQFIDRTNQARKMTFFGEGMVAHVAFADPVCLELKESIFKANRDLKIRVHNGGTYLNMEGPAFSTRAESNVYRSWGAHVIGMTNMAEARLAREAGMCYATISMVTDYDCWYVSKNVETVSVEMVMDNMKKNSETAKTMIRNTVNFLSEDRKCSCGDSLRHAVVTPMSAVPKRTLNKLKIILGDHGPR